MRFNTIITFTVFIITYTLQAPSYAATKNYTHDLKAIFELAKDEPNFLAADAHAATEAAAVPLALSALLPHMNLNSSIAQVHNNIPGIHQFNTRDITLALSQELIQLEKISRYQAADFVKLAAIATLKEAKQNLILKIINQYFAILTAEDNLTFAKAKHLAFKRSFEQVNERFKVGLTPITDLHEARAKNDIAAFEELAAINAKNNEFEKLFELTKTAIFIVAPLKPKIPLHSPNPKHIEYWINTAEEHNFELAALRYILKRAQLELQEKQSGHLPSLSLHANILNSKPPKSIPQTPKYNQNQVSLNLNIPLFSGGETSTKAKIAALELKETNYKLQAKQRNIVSNTKQAFRNIETLITQIQALDQAVVSSKTALQATNAAFNVGTRTIVDVLNSETDYLQATRDYKRAHYSYILEQLRLNALCGRLTEDAIKQINDLLTS